MKPMYLPAIRWRPGKLAFHGSSLLGWMLLRAGIQAATVFLLARQLGAQSYGQFVVVIAIASFVTPFVGLGLANMVLRNGARDPANLPVYMARSVRWWGLTLLPCLAAAMLVAVFLLPAGLPPLAVFAAITSELIAGSLTELRARHRQAEHRIGAYGAINAGLPAIRLGALGLLFLVSDEVGIPLLLWTYATSSLVYALILWAPIPSGSGSPADATPEPMHPTSGFPFSLATFAGRMQAEFNKPALAHLGFDLAGAYSVAQRANDLASMPLSALQESLWPRLYAQSDPGRQLKRTGLALLALAFACGVAIWLAAPLLPWLLGNTFLPAVRVMRGLAWLPVLQVFRSLVNFHVIHHGRMSLMGWSYGAGALLSISLVWFLVPRWGVTGAIAASYLTEIAMIITLMVGSLGRRAA